MKNGVILMDFEDQHGELCPFFATELIFEVQILILKGQW